MLIFVIILCIFLVILRAQLGSLALRHQSCWACSAPLNVGRKTSCPGPLAEGTRSLSVCLEEGRAHGKMEDFKYVSEI